MHVHEVARAVGSSDLTTTQRAIIWAMCSHEGFVDFASGRYWGSNASLARRAGIKKVRTVSTHLIALEGEWFDTVEEKRGGVKTKVLKTPALKRQGCPEKAVPPNGSADTKRQSLEAADVPTDGSTPLPFEGRGVLPSKGTPYKKEEDQEVRTAEDHPEFEQDAVWFSNEMNWLFQESEDFNRQPFVKAVGVLTRHGQDLVSNGVLSWREYLKWCRTTMDGLALSDETYSVRGYVSCVKKHQRMVKTLEDWRGEKTQVIKTYIPHQDRPEIVADRARYSEITKGMTLEEEIQYLKDSQIPVVHDNEPLMDPEIIKRIMRGGS